MSRVDLYDKINALEQVFEELEGEMTRFKSKAAIGCPAGCGRCCLKPDIEATVLEFLPLAGHLVQTGRAEAWYDRLSAEVPSVCVVFSSLGKEYSGFCSEYAHRGLICRLFGFSAALDKHEKKRLATCTVIKDRFPNELDRIAATIDDLQVPVMRNYFLKLSAIDLELGTRFYPINQAIKLAIGEVLAYHAYRDS